MSHAARVAIAAAVAIGLAACGGGSHAPASGFTVTGPAVQVTVTTGDLAWNTENLLIGATRNWARSIALWNLVLDENSGPTNGGCMGCRGVVTIDTRTVPATITRNVEYYALGQLAEFALPGAVRIDSNSDAGGGIEDVAFQNPDGSIALLALNPASMAQSFSVAWHGAYFNYTLPAQSVATFVWH